MIRPLLLSFIFIIAFPPFCTPRRRRVRTDLREITRNNSALSSLFRTRRVLCLMIVYWILCGKFRGITLPTVFANRVRAVFVANRFVVVVVVGRPFSSWNRACRIPIELISEILSAYILLHCDRRVCMRVQMKIFLYLFKPVRVLGYTRIEGPRDSLHRRRRSFWPRCVRAVIRISRRFV